MKPRLSTRSHRFLLWTFRRGSILAVGLVAALLAVACASSAPTETPPPTAADPVDAQPAATEALALTEAPAAQTEAPAAAIDLPPFTPRGDALEATDPTTVSLASGGLQLVEFFRFT